MTPQNDLSPSHSRELASRYITLKGGFLPLATCVARALCIVGSFVCLLNVADAGAEPTLSALSHEELGGAALINAPVRQVLILHDAAVVTREGEALTSPQGVLVRLPDLPVNAQEVQLHAEGAEVMRLTQQRRSRSDLDLARFEELVAQLEQLKADASRLAAQGRAPQQELEWLEQLTPDLTQTSHTWRATPTLNASSLLMWGELRALFEQRRAQARAQLNELALKLNEVMSRAQTAQAALNELLMGARERQVTEVIALLQSSQPRAAKLSVSYTLQGAQWTPTYELHVDVQRARVRRSFGAQISQHTGEDWREVEVEVSTRRLQASIERPKLVSWTLGEARDFKPQLRPARAAQPRPLLAPPHPLSSLPKDDQDKLKLSALQARYQAVSAGGLLSAQRDPHLASLLERAQGGAQGRSQGARGVGAADLTGSPARSHAKTARPRPRLRPASRRAALSPPPPPPPPAPSAYAEATLESYDLDDAPASAPYLASKRAPSRSASYGSASSSPSALGGLTFEDGVMYAGESVRALSAQLSASYSFKAPNHATLLHSAPALVVPIEVSERSIALSYEATPALSPYAYLTGELTHMDKRPLLAGPASLFSAGAFVGETQLSSALKGDKITLFLGADPDVRLDRRVEVESHTKGLISAREISVYTTKIQVANDKRRAVKLKLYDVLPLSQHDEVEVSLKQLTPKAKIDKESGVVCWELELKAGARADLTFIYQVSRPKGWRVSQR